MLLAEMVEIGGADEDRTHDLLNAIQALSQTELRPHGVRNLTLSGTQNSSPESAAHSTLSSMQKPKYGKQRSASGTFSLSRSLPKLRLPASAVPAGTPRPRPQAGKPGGRRER